MPSRYARHFYLLELATIVSPFAHSAYASSLWALTFAIHTLIVGDVARGILAEVTKIVYELHHHIATYGAI